MENGRPFQNVIESEEEIRSMIGEPSELSQRKVLSALDRHCRDFIALSPFLMLSTSDGTGGCDASPKGDAPGFVQVLDERHLAIPDRPGNRRIDSLRNILQNPQVGILFLIPGLEETLRINGSACILKDPNILGGMQVNGKTPALAIGVTVRECFLHCAKAAKRSKLWQPESWPAPASLPNAARIYADHGKGLGYTEQDVQEILHESYTKRMY